MDGAMAGLEKAVPSRRTSSVPCAIGDIRVIRG